MYGKPATCCVYVNGLVLRKAKQDLRRNVQCRAYRRAAARENPIAHACGLFCDCCKAKVTNADPLPVKNLPRHQQVIRLDVAVKAEIR